MKYKKNNNEQPILPLDYVKGLVWFLLLPHFLESFIDKQAECHICHERIPDPKEAENPVVFHKWATLHLVDSLTLHWKQSLVDNLHELIFPWDFRTTAIPHFS